MEKFFLIYKYTSPSGKSYIGQTSNIKQRKISHKNAKNKCTSFNRAVNKYRYENFTLEILEENLTLEEANIFEELYIEQYNTISPNGYNLRSGGLNQYHSNEAKQKMSKNHADFSGENHPLFGVGHSEETKQKMSETKIGKYLGENNPFFGKHHSNKTKTHLSKINSGENHPNWGKFGENHPSFGLVGEKNKQSKKYIITYPDGHQEIIIGLQNFCKEHNLDASTMVKIAKGKENTHKGFKCRYFVEDN